MSGMGFEPMPTYGTHAHIRGPDLKSGALDRSATLTDNAIAYNLHFYACILSYTLLIVSKIHWLVGKLVSVIVYCLHAFFNVAVYITQFFVQI